MRIVIAALLGAIVMFLWEFVAHMLLPVGEMGMRLTPNEDAVLQTVSTQIAMPGIYIVPGIDRTRMSDASAMKAYTDKARNNPAAFIVVSNGHQDAMQMGPNLSKQFIGDYFAALIVAALLAAAPLRFGVRVLGSLGFGVFGWLTNIVPQWNWYRFPADFMYGNLIEQGVGWLLAGVAMAWWLGRRAR